MSWHAEDELLQRYASGALDAANSFSVEAHILACDDCRMRVPRDTTRLDAIWSGVRGSISAPATRFTERLMRVLGINEHTARLLAATPALSTSWLAGIAATLAFIILASHNKSGDPLPFLLVAPVLPLAGVATAYGRGVDPTYEIGASAPMRGLRLLMIRSLAVFVTTSALAVAASFALPRVDLNAAAWILPAVALATVCLALSTWLSPLRSAVIVALAWMAVVIVSLAVATGPLRVQTIAAFREGEQAWLAATALLGVLVLVVRRNHFERMDG